MIDYELFSNMTIQEDVLKLRIENEELKQQIKKLKCCSNCKHQNKRYQMNDICDSCFVYDKWELAE